VGTSDAGQRCGHRSFRVYQKAEELAAEINRLTARYPQSEVYGAAAQSRAAALSIVSNIAEGYRRCSRREFVRFLKIAYGSCGELDAQISVAIRSGWIPKPDSDRVLEEIDTVSRWLWRLMESLSIPKQQP
jgi:four helix bundle protein